MPRKRDIFAKALDVNEEEHKKDYHNQEEIFLQFQNKKIGFQI